VMRSPKTINGVDDSFEMALEDFNDVDASVWFGAYFVSLIHKSSY